MLEESLQVVEQNPHLTETNKKIESVLQRASVDEQELDRITTEFMTNLQQQMAEEGITEEQINDPDFSQAARTIFFDSTNKERLSDPVLQEVRKNYPKLAKIADINHDAIVELNSKHDQLVETKRQLLPELHNALEEEYKFVISRIDYDTGLSTDSPFEFLTDVGSLADLVVKSDDDKDEFEFDRKKWAHDRAKQTITKLNEKNLIKQTENTPPTEKETKEAKRQLSSVSTTIKKIDLHNDIAGLSRKRDEYIDTPPFIKAVSRLPKSKFSMISVAKIAENPYLENELGKRIKSEKSDLKLNKRITWEDKINPEIIYSIIEKVDTAKADLEKTARNTVVEEIFARYQEMFEKTPSNRGETARSLNVDQFFVDTIKELVQDESPMTPLDRRILNSQMVALHFLFMSHGIDRIYENYLNSVPPNETPQTKEQEWKAKSVLAMDFLRKNIRKNKESTIARKNIEAATVGIEYEYTDRLEGYLSTDPLVDNFIDQMKDIIAEKKDKGEDSTSDENLLKIIEEAREVSIKNSRQVLFGDREHFPSAVQIFNIVDILSKDPTVTSTVSQLGTFSEDIEHSPSYREIITEPSISYRMQMREIVQTMARGALEGNLNPHFTVGNVELNPNNPEASEFRILLMGAGLVDVEETVQDDTYVRGEEKFWKLTSFDAKLYYLPFHHIRSGPEMKRYNTRYTPSGFEIRTFTHGTGEAKQFPKHIKTLAFISSAAFGVQATQKDPDLRTKNEQKLATLWSDLMQDWQKILAENGIDFLPMDKRFAEVEIERTETDSKLKYLDESTKESYRKYMTAVQKARSQNPKFAAQVNQIMRNYRKKANKLIGYQN